MHARTHARTHTHTHTHIVDSFFKGPPPPKKKKKFDDESKEFLLSYLLFLLCPRGSEDAADNDSFHAFSFDLFHDVLDLLPINLFDLSPVHPVAPVRKMGRAEDDVFQIWREVGERRKSPRRGPTQPDDGNAAEVFVLNDGVDEVGGADVDLCHGDLPLLLTRSAEYGKHGVPNTCNQ